jgi:hypothetical protein
VVGSGFCAHHRSRDVYAALSEKAREQLPTRVPARPIRWHEANAVGGKQRVRRIAANRDPLASGFRSQDERAGKCLARGQENRVSRQRSVDCRLQMVELATACAHPQCCTGSDRGRADPDEEADDEGRTKRQEHPALEDLECTWDVSRAAISAPLRNPRDLIDQTVSTKQAAAKGNSTVCRNCTEAVGGSRFS